MIQIWIVILSAGGVNKNSINEFKLVSNVCFKLFYYTLKNKPKFTCREFFTSLEM